MTSAFTIIRDMTDKLPNTNEQNIFLNVLTLDDWVHLYRLNVAAEAVGAVERTELYRELTQNGLVSLCQAIADRMVKHLFGDDAGAQHLMAEDHKFNLLAHLEQGILDSLIPDILRVP